MQFTVCEQETPPIKNLIEQKYIPWYCDVDTSDEWYSFAMHLGSFTLPLISVIDPADSSSYLDRTTGVQKEDEFYSRLQSHVPTETEQFSLTIVKAGTGEGMVQSNLEEVQCGLSCSVARTILPKSAKVTLSAAPAYGSVFNGWGGGECTGTTICEVTMDNDLTVTADFAGIHTTERSSILVPLIHGLLQGNE